MAKVTHVAVAILQKQNGDFLLSSRPHGKPWAGWWEFPGGKVENDETPQHALVRELKEELGIQATHFQPWIKRRFDYPKTHDSQAKAVHLHFFFVNCWQGELTPHEGQQLSWQTPANIMVQPVLPANAPIMKALALPPIYAISNLAEMDEEKFFHALDKQLKDGLRLIQVREKHLQKPILESFIEQVIFHTKPYGAKVLINDDVDLARKLGADGVHLSSTALMAMNIKPINLLVAASCHNTTELAHAQQLDLDFVVFSPVKATKSHPGMPPVGWQRFAEIIQNTELPVYALGGMVLDDLPLAWAYGARGIAMQRAIWQR